MSQGFAWGSREKRVHLVAERAIHPVAEVHYCMGNTWHGSEQRYQAVLELWKNNGRPSMADPEGEGSVCTEKIVSMGGEQVRKVLGYCSACTLNTLPRGFPSILWPPTASIPA